MQSWDEHHWIVLLKVFFGADSKLLQSSIFIKTRQLIKPKLNTVNDHYIPYRSYGQSLCYWYRWINPRWQLLQVKV